MKFQIGYIISTRKGVYFFHILLACIFMCNATYAQEEIKLNKEKSGLYTIPCEVNGLRLRFILDTGATDVSISLTEASFMHKNGYLEDEDFLGTAKTLIASGEVQENYLIKIKQIRVGTKVLNNIKASVVKGLSAPLLLGQSVLSQLGEWSIRDNYLVLYDRSGNDFSKYTESDWKQRIEETINTPADWDADLKYLMPGVLADDYNTILRAGYVMQYTERSPKKDEETVIHKLERLTTNGDKEAAFVLGYLYLHKAKNLDDVNKAKCYFEKLIDGKTLYTTKQFFTYETAYENLYIIYSKHLGQPEVAIQILQNGALLNDANCITYLWGEYEDRKNYTKLYQWADKLSQTCKGYSKSLSLYKKAKCLMEGIGISKNVSQGIKLLQQIANSKLPADDEVYMDLCDYFLTKNNYQLVEEYAFNIKLDKFYQNYFLGCAYYFKKDYSSARRYLKKLWDKVPGRLDFYKWGFGSCLLGHCYEEGLGGAISYKDAEKCYMYAYEKCDFFGALGYLGDMYSNDKIYQNPNYEAAFGCYLQGAKNEDAYCCYMVSQYYKHGIGTEENINESNYWLKKAKENGWKEQ